MLQLDDVEGQARLEQIDDRPGAAVTGIADDRERLQPACVDIAQQVIYIRCLDVERLDGAALCRGLELGRILPAFTSNTAGSFENPDAGIDHVLDCQPGYRQPGEIFA